MYSRADGLSARIHFPGEGLRRWQDIVCRTLALVRSWRIVDGPSPQDCSKIPRLSLAGVMRAPG
jgi:hypothetical protein